MSTEAEAFNSSRMIATVSTVSSTAHSDKLQKTICHIAQVIGYLWLPDENFDFSGARTKKDKRKSARPVQYFAIETIYKG